MILGLAAAMLPRAAAADEVYLKSGGQLSGRIVSRSAGMIEVDIGAGRIAVTESSVLRIEEGRSPLQEFEERAAHIPASDVQGWLALGDWATGAGLSSQAREAAYNRAERVAQRRPREPGARQLAGQRTLGERGRGLSRAGLRALRGRVDHAR
jgi:hypothetical protein